MNWFRYKIYIKIKIYVSFNFSVSYLANSIHLFINIIIYFINIKEINLLVCKTKLAATNKIVFKNIKSLTFLKIHPYLHKIARCFLQSKISRAGKMMQLLMEVVF